MDDRDARRFIGTNRDETRLYLYQDPRFNPLLASARADYVRYARFGSLAWKQRSVDDVARAMYAGGHRDIFTYRFDWDEQGLVNGVDLSLALGAAHSVEIPFVFGHGTGLAAFGDPQAAGRVQLTRSVQSYWSEFVYTGAPGTGRDGREVAWTAWHSTPDTPKLLIFDTAADGGVRMSSEQITSEKLRRAVLAETGFGDHALHADLYRELFDTRAFARDFPPSDTSHTNV